MTVPVYGWRGRLIALEKGDYALARDHATARMAANADTAHNKYWTSLELAIHGYLAEVAAWRLLHLEPQLSTDDSEGGADILGFYQVKNNTWRRSLTMDEWDGGHCYVPVTSRAPVVILITMFADTLERRAFYEGWTTLTEARRWPIRHGFRKAHAVPYMALRQDPLPAAPGLS